MTATILLVEDDPSLKLVLSRALTEAGYRVRATESLDTCLKWCGDGLGDALVLDVFVGGRNSIEA
ncbi:MAG TPA: nitrogen regulation protein NR(I), partial [Hyphomonadaceae bacterium]|nr:nitrogen regulation protein NR(I) [Hyphomonadaceae bacterium]